METTFGERAAEPKETYNQLILQICNLALFLFLVNILKLLWLTNIDRKDLVVSVSKKLYL